MYKKKLPNIGGKSKRKFWVLAMAGVLVCINVSARGIDVYGPKKARHIAEFESALLTESFETCQHGSFEMPYGWTTQSLGQTAGDGEDHWIGLSKDYSDYYMFPGPADGRMMVGVFYSDELQKDEWLLSPHIHVPGKDYELSFHWYTRPLYVYKIDMSHVDFENGVFLKREVVFNFQALVREGEGEWNVLFDLEKEVSGMEYDELAELDFDVMQRAAAPLADYDGKEIQIAFRYFGREGNTITLDAVSIDLLKPTISYQPDYSRLFFGFSPDEDLWWMPASIEFYPVNHPITWYNDSSDKKGVDFGWVYYDIDAEGNLSELSVDSNDPEFSVAYRPDYADEMTLTNNFYPMPKLLGRGPEGGVASFTSKYNFLQAGGTTEYLSIDPQKPSQREYKKYVATNFDIINEGLGIFARGNDDLGFFEEPIFGRSVNTDQWWVHYCYPDQDTADKYAYVDGFANLYMPHPSAPMVVKGVSVAADGDIYDDAQFTLKIYAMDSEGYLVETPIAQKTILGKDVIKFSDYMTRYYLVLNFELDNPVVFSTEGTGYGYMVEISGYHDDNIRYFAPLQSMAPNEYEWAFGYYHLYSSLDETYDRNLTDQFGYVAGFRDDYGRELYSSFAIGLDAHYPWLELDSPDDAFEYVAEGTNFNLRGYYPAEDYKIEAPGNVDVKLQDRYMTRVSVSPVEKLEVDEVVPVKISAPGVEIEVNVLLKAGSGIENAITDKNFTGDVYNMQGILVIKNAGSTDLESLPTGTYIFNGRKIQIK